MCKRILIVTQVIFLGAFSTGLGAVDMSPIVYFRGGSGITSKSSLPECFNNQGIPGNPFRLGNECGYYGELGARLNQTLSSDWSMAFQFRLSSSGPNRWQWEDNDSDGREIQFVEAFVSGESNGIQGWIGERFYRDIDSHIFDWYYFAEMNGIGAGLSQIPFAGGQFSIAHLIQGRDTSSSRGKAALQVLDGRYEHKTKVGIVKLWAALGTSPSYEESGKRYLARQGGLLGVRHQWLWADGFADVALVHGRGVMEGMNIYGNTHVLESERYLQQAWRQRWVINSAGKLSSRFGALATVAGEFANDGKDRSDWQAVGVRPIYFMSDHSQALAEGGCSRIWTEAGTSHRILCRATVGLQWTFGDSVWSRPAMRLLYTHSWWNDDNGAKIPTNAPSYAGARQGGALIYQFELWQY